jgi:hypothetical protein
LILIGTAGKMQVAVERSEIQHEDAGSPKLKAALGCGAPRGKPSLKNRHGLALAKKL